MYLKLPQLQVARFNETMELEDASWNATVDLEYSDEWGLNDTRAFRYKYRKALELNASADGEGLTIWLNPCEVEQGSRCVHAWQVPCLGLQCRVRELLLNSQTLKKAPLVCQKQVMAQLWLSCSSISPSMTSFAVLWRSRTWCFCQPATALMSQREFGDAVMVHGGPLPCNCHAHLGCKPSSLAKPALCAPFQKQNLLLVWSQVVG